MPALFLIIIALQYLFTFFFLRSKEYHNFCLLYIASIWMYDYVFINLSYDFPLIALLLKPYNEYLAIYFGALLALNKFRDISIKEPIITLLILPAIAVLLITDIPQKHSLSAIATGFRLYLTPVVLPYLMQNCGVFNKLDYNRILNLCILLVIASGVYGIYQAANFSGSVRSLWFYDYFNRYTVNPVLEGDVNFIRDDKIRITSFFVSPIIYTCTLCIPFILCLSKLFFVSAQKKWQACLPNIVICILVIVFQFQANTRVGIIIDILAAALLLSDRFIRMSFVKYLLVPISLVIATFLTLFLKLSSDLSAQGRLIQYRQFLKEFRIRGLGFGSELVNVHHDSLLISVILLFGIIGILPFLYWFLLSKKIYMQYLVDRDFFTKAVLAMSISSIYLFAFQFCAGSAFYRLYFVLIFIVLSHAIRKEPAIA